jgi:hypothetical protein
MPYQLIDKLRKSRTVSKLIPHLEGDLQAELNSLSNVLDIGCGPRPLVSRNGTITEIVGVEAYEPYAKRAEISGRYDKIICADALSLELPRGCFDAVLLIDVIEHLEHESALRLIAKAEEWARKKIIISTPNGFVEQRALDGNPLQQHRSGWNVDDLRRLGYQSRGMAGLKWLRSEIDGDEFGTNILVSIKYKPRFLWFVLASFTQVFTYRIPKLAFSLLAVKNL